jgi:hypothetical protein
VPMPSSQDAAGALAGVCVFLFFFFFCTILLDVFFCEFSFFDLSAFFCFASHCFFLNSFSAAMDCEEDHSRDCYAKTLILGFLDF